MQKIILVTGFTLFFIGLAIFGTETAFQFAMSASLIIIGLAVMNWITTRYDFTKTK